MKHRQVYNPLLVYDVYLKTATYKFSDLRFGPQILTPNRTRDHHLYKIEPPHVNSCQINFQYNTYQTRHLIFPPKFLKRPTIFHLKSNIIGFY
jgi:hypothetical protein